MLLREPRRLRQHRAVADMLDRANSDPFRVIRVASHRVHHWRLHRKDVPSPSLARALFERDTDEQRQASRGGKRRER